MLENDILITLLYYDIFAYPLTAREVYLFLPRNSVTPSDVHAALATAATSGSIHECDGFYSLRADVAAHVDRRRRMERYARRHWRVARVMTHVIKRFPFVRGVFITGTLSKNLSAPDLDIDFFIVTAPGRLWIARTALIAFKQTVLFGRRKYFCLNYFISEDALEIEDRNVFTATEIAHTKALYNEAMLRRWVDRNPWIREYFPNWRIDEMPLVRAGNRRSLLARLLERPLSGRLGDRLDIALMRWWDGVWRRRYPDLPDTKRDELFRVRRTTSKAHGPDFQTRILAAFRDGCERRGVSPQEHPHGPHPSRA